MSALAITAITNFILAAEVFFLAGILFGQQAMPASPLWWWRLTLLALGTAAFIGGVDHGFFETIHHPRRRVLQVLTWLPLGVVTFGMLMTTASQFFPGSWFFPVLTLGLLQMVVYVVLVFRLENFMVVIVNYGPVLLLMLVTTVLNLKAYPGLWPLVVGLITLVFASVIQALGVDKFSPLDRNGLYHGIAMVGVGFLFWGGWFLRSF